MQTNRPGWFYDFARIVWRGVFFFTMRCRCGGLEHEPGSGGVIVAVCHLNHLDPVVVSAALWRRIGWISRVEFCRHWFLRVLLHFSGAFPVNRSGYARPALREGLQRLAEGEAIGIFPEGEIMSGTASVLLQGQLRHGVCWLAARSGRPVLPVIVLGTDRLSKLEPWLPAKRGRLWLTAGVPLTAPPEARTKAGRAVFAAQLEAEFRRLFHETRHRHDLPESIVP